MASLAATALPRPDAPPVTSATTLATLQNSTADAIVLTFDPEILGSYNYRVLCDGLVAPFLELGVELR